MANPASSSRSRTCAATVDLPEPSVPTSATTHPVSRRPSGDACRPAGTMVCRWRQVLGQRARLRAVARHEAPARPCAPAAAVGLGALEDANDLAGSGAPRPRRHTVLRRPRAARRRCSAQAARASSTRAPPAPCPAGRGRTSRSAAAAGARSSCGASACGAGDRRSAGISSTGPTRRSPWVRSTTAKPRVGTHHQARVAQPGGVVGESATGAAGQLAAQALDEHGRIGVRGAAARAPPEVEVGRPGLGTATGRGPRTPPARPSRRRRRAGSRRAGPAASARRAGRSAGRRSVRRGGPR